MCFSQSLRFLLVPLILAVREPSPALNSEGRGVQEAKHSPGLGRKEKEGRREQKTSPRSYLNPQGTPERLPLGKGGGVRAPHPGAETMEGVLESHECLGEGERHGPFPVSPSTRPWGVG